MPATIKVPKGLKNPVAEAIRRRKSGGSKYKAQPVVYDGIKYSSRSEAAYAEHLDGEVKAGRVLWWLRQVRITLGIAECVIVVDFVVAKQSIWHPGVEIEAHEPKGSETAKFRKDKRLWERFGPFPLRVIKPKCVYKTLPNGEKTCTIKSIEDYVVKGGNERFRKLGGDQF